MNIFVLDYDKQTNAKYHCDKHVVKMLVEQTQLLCSTYYFSNESHKSPYKLTHKNHPCSIWTRQSLSNWIWLRDMTLSLYDEYQHRYGKVHKSGEIAKLLQIPTIDDIGLTPFAQAMPDEYKDSDPVIAYRNYYNGAKQHLFKWSNRSIPEWICERTATRW